MDIVGIIIERLKGCNLAGQNPTVYRAIDEPAAYSLLPDCDNAQPYIAVVPFDKTTTTSDTSNARYTIAERMRVIGIIPRKGQQRDVNDGGDQMAREGDALQDAIMGRLAGFIPAQGGNCTKPVEILRQALINTNNYGRVGCLTVIRVEYQATLTSVCYNGGEELPLLKRIDANLLPLDKEETPDFSVPPSQS